MAISRTTVWNNAISVMGGDATGIIQDVDDKGDVAKWLRAFEEDAAEFCIALFPWQEATAFVQLGTTSDTVAKADWGFAYDKPSDFLKIIDFTNECGRAIKEPYEILGKYIVSDADPGYIRYVRKMAFVPDNTGDSELLDMSPQLRDLIAKRLAVMIAPVYKPKMLSTAVGQFDLSLNEARAVTQDNVFVKPTGWIYDIS